MSEVLSSAKINRQHAELLPARTVLSLFSTQGPSDTGSFGGSGDNGQGGIGVNILNATGDLDDLINGSADDVG